MTTTSETFTHEHTTIHTRPIESIRPAPIARTHFTRMAGLYAWILVTLAIFLIAGMLSGIQKSQAPAGLNVHHVGGLSTIHLAAR